MDAEELRKVERVDARLVWSHEALEFTPWLEEHIDELAERIGVELQIDAREVEVGPFAADLVGRDVTTGAGLLIENQLGATDHGHLGQLITYAAGLDTRVMVWISTEIREEHRQAVDWLAPASRRLAQRRDARGVQLLRSPRRTVEDRRSVCAGLRDPRESEYLAEAGSQRYFWAPGRRRAR